MAGVRLLSIGAILVGVALFVGGLAVPTCRNFAGTARDSGYPCKVERSSGSTQFIFSRTSSVRVPLATPLAIGLLVLGVLGVARTRRAGPPRAEPISSIETDGVRPASPATVPAMTSDEWDVISTRLAGAWPEPPMDPERRAVYLDVLSDVRVADVSDAIAELMREERETLPPPGVIRSRALRLAAGRGEIAELVEAGDGELDVNAETNARPTMAVPGLGEVALSPATEGPFNHRALWGLLFGIVGALGPIAVRAAIQTADPDSDPPYFYLEAFVLAIVAIALSASGRSRADETGRGKGLATVGIFFAVLAFLVALGSFGLAGERREEGRAAAGVLQADPATVSSSDRLEFSDVNAAVEEWNAAASDALLGYQRAVDGTAADTERWLNAAPGQVAAMRGARARIRTLVGSMSDKGLRQTLDPFVRSYNRQTMLVAQLLGAVQSENRERELATQGAIDLAASEHQRLSAEFQDALERAATRE